MAYASTSSNLTDRMIRAARLEVGLYEEVERDPNATTQALLVVVLAALANGIGLALGGAMAREGGNPVGGLVIGIVMELVGWAIWAYVMFWVGTHFFKGTATWGEVLRTTGFAFAPGVLLVLRFIPLVGGLLALGVGIWRLVAAFIAIRQALDIDNTNTFLTILVGILAYLVAVVVLTVIFSALGLGVAMMAGGV